MMLLLLLVDVALETGAGEVTESPAAGAWPRVACSCCVSLDDELDSLGSPVTKCARSCLFLTSSC